MTINPFRIPTDPEIAEAERKLDCKFPSTYVEFLKGGSNVANAAFEPAVILPGCNYLDIFEIAETAWGQMGVSREWLPFIEDNSDYFLISPTGEVQYWSHNGATNEKWPNLAAWFQQVCVERR
jgi:SMI1-KNR4 cell-wall